jgi:hypothetical protein
VAPSGTQIHIVSVNTLPVAHYGEGSFVFRVVMNVTSGDASVVATVDEIGFLKGRLEVSATFTGIGSPFPAATQSRLMLLLRVAPPKHRRANKAISTTERSPASRISQRRQVPAEQPKQAPNAPLTRNSP